MAVATATAFTWEESVSLTTVLVDVLVMAHASRVCAFATLVGKEKTVPRSSFVPRYVQKRGLEMMFATQIAIHPSASATKETVRMFAFARKHGLVMDRAIKCAITVCVSMMMVTVLKKSVVLDADPKCLEMAIVTISAIQKCAIWTNMIVKPFRTAHATQFFREMACVMTTATLLAVCMIMETALYRLQKTAVLKLAHPL